MQQLRNNFFLLKKSILDENILLKKILTFILSWIFTKLHEIFIKLYKNGKKVQLKVALFSMVYCDGAKLFSKIKKEIYCTTWNNAVQQYNF